ncbi:hypothetical protein [Caulobacter sp. 1776]|uniref:hypothetical protein n=1 Tax=Caulobacter sp. 1776 TaxID=3156420 RepID=UPI00339B3FE1
MPCSRLLALAGALTLLAPASARASVESDTRTVDTLVAAYHEAVVSHDGARLLQLFAPTGTAWYSALSDEALTRARRAKPDVAKLRPGSAQAFAAMVSNSKASLDPRHGDMKILSDGTIATLYFDFSFLIDGQEQNRGSESWQLVRGAEGWRIVSIIYSSDPPVR